MGTAGTLVVSLDLELHWGMLDHLSLRECGPTLRRVPRAVERMLALFERYEVSATWATVGLLMARDRAEALELAPDTRPTYRDTRLDAYAHLSSDDVLAHPSCYFAPELVRRIADTPGQEVGTHTFSHYYCLAEGQTEAHFAADLASAREAASRLGVSLASIVFPRNQYSAAYLETCRGIGLRAVRGNPRSRLYAADADDQSRLLKRLGRLVDAHAPVVPFSKLDATPSDLGDGLRDVPGSRFLRVGLPAPQQRIVRERVVREMRHAAERGRHYHLWWHPHNMGAAPERGLAELDAVLRAFASLRGSHGMRSRTMSEAAAGE